MKPRWSLLVVSACLMCATSCGESTKSPVNTEAALQELRVGVSRNLVNGPRDPWYVHNSLNVWEPLVKLDDELRPVPGLAERWSRTDDGLTWTFELRRGVAFSDGAAWDADAALANLARMRLVSGHPSNFFNLNFEDSYGTGTRIEKVDEFTIRFVHQHPIPEFPSSISNFFSAMFSPRGFDAAGDFTSLPAGTGPFMLVAWKRDQGFELRRNDGYWGAKARLQKIVGSIYPDANVRLSALRAGEVDALVELGPLLPSQAVQLKDDPEIAVEGMPSSCSVYLAYNGWRPPFDDPRLRRAVDMALPRDTIVREIVYGFGAPGLGILTVYAPSMRSTHPLAQVRFDPQSAAALAREVLGAQRRRVSLVFTLSTGNFARPFGPIAAFLQATLRPLGLDVDLMQLESAAATDATRSGMFDLTLSNGAGCAPFGDPDYALRRLLSSTSPMNAKGEGNGGFRNAEAERLLDEARGTLDAGERAAKYDRLQQIAATEVPISLIYSEQQVIAYRRSVRGLRQRVTYQPTFDTAFLQP